MQSIDYSFFYKKRFPLDGGVLNSITWDVFISCFDNSDRVKELYKYIQAAEKMWLINPRYKISPQELPPEEKFILEGEDESSFINGFFDANQRSWRTLSICVDITGFSRPDLLYLFYYLNLIGVSKVSVLYSEPSRYIKDHLTRFTDNIPLDPRAVFGYEGLHVQKIDSDTLVIGIGYDDELLSRVSKNKSLTRKIPLFCLPSLQADMYQQSKLRASLVQDIEASGLSFFAPANDPFVTAGVLREIISKLSKFDSITNLYLSPLGTKAQALGFALYYLYERRDSATSIIYPFTEGYTPGSSQGISKVWHYTVILPGV